MLVIADHQIPELRPAKGPVARQMTGAPAGSRPNDDGQRDGQTAWLAAPDRFASSAPPLQALDTGRAQPHPAHCRRDLGRGKAAPLQHPAHDQRRSFAGTAVDRRVQMPLQFCDDLPLYSVVGHGCFRSRRYPDGNHVLFFCFCKVSCPPPKGHRPGQPNLACRSSTIEKGHGGTFEKYAPDPARIGRPAHRDLPQRKISVEPQWLPTHRTVPLRRGRPNNPVFARLCHQSNTARTVDEQIHVKPCNRGPGATPHQLNATFGGRLQVGGIRSSGGSR